MDGIRRIHTPGQVRIVYGTAGGFGTNRFDVDRLAGRPDGGDDNDKDDPGGVVESSAGKNSPVEIADGGVVESSTGKNSPVEIADGAVAAAVAVSSTLNAESGRTSLSAGATMPWSGNDET
jgi:hypothetical protein